MMRRAEPRKPVARKGGAYDAAAREAPLAALLGEGRKFVRVGGCHA